MVQQDNSKNEKGQTLDAFIRDYKTNQLNKYEKPSVTVDTLLFTVREQRAVNYRKLPRKDLHVLLIKRKDHPCINQWALPGGFINMNENLDTSALRELKEETNLEDIYLEQLYTFGDQDRDPRTRIMSVAYLALIPEEHGGKLKAGDDAAEACWFRVSYKKVSQEMIADRHEDREVHQHYELTLKAEKENLCTQASISLIHRLDKKGINQEVVVVDSGDLAFDHAKVIAYGLERLRNKLSYTDIIFNLMPRYFTLSELQQVHELLLGEKVYPAQFRRKMEPKLSKISDQSSVAKGHRPAQLYEYNPLWILSDNVEKED